MAILSILVFGAAFAASVWTLWATIAPQADRIIDLLAHGPVATPLLPAPVPARSSLRNVTVREVGRAAPQRAAA